MDPRIVTLCLDPGDGLDGDGHEVGALLQEDPPEHLLAERTLDAFTHRRQRIA